MSTPSQSYDRRQFLVRTAALLAAGVTAACENSPLAPLLGKSEDGGLGDGTLYLFGNESGEFVGRDPFVVGLLLTADPDAHETTLSELRDGSGYCSELRYGSTDRFKEDYTEAALNHFFESDDLTFAAAAVNASRSAGGLDATALYEELLRLLTDGGAGATLRMEHRFYDRGPDDALESRLDGIPGVSVEFIPSYESDLLQLGDLLTGSIRGDMARMAKGRSNPRGRAPGGNVKDRLIASLKELLNVQRLAHPSLAKREKFSVQVLHPPF